MNYSFLKNIFQNKDFTILPLMIGKIHLNKIKKKGEL